MMQSSRESETRPCHQQDRITPPLRKKVCYLIVEEIKFLTPGHQVTMHLEPPIFGVQLDKPNHNLDRPYILLHRHRHFLNKILA